MPDVVDEFPPDEIPAADVEAAAPPSRRLGQQRGAFGTRLSPKDRAQFMEALRQGATFGAAAMLIGRSRNTIERWRIRGRAGVKGYVKLYEDMEKAKGRSINRLHEIAHKAAAEDGRLALALLDRLDPEFKSLREQKRPESSVEVVTQGGVLNSDGSMSKNMTRVRYHLSWDDGAPVKFPGIGQPLLSGTLEPDAASDDDEEATDDLERMPEKP